MQMKFSDYENNYRPTPLNMGQFIVTYMQPPAQPAPPQQKWPVYTNY